MSKFHPFSKVRRCRHFSVKNWNFSLLQNMHPGGDSNFCKFHEFWTLRIVPGGETNKFCKFHDSKKILWVSWRTLRKCQIRRCRHFSVENWNFSKLLQISYAWSDSNKFCKFHEFWRTLRKCQNFILFLRDGAVSIFLSKIETSPNCFKFSCFW